MPRRRRSTLAHLPRCAVIVAPLLLALLASAAAPRAAAAAPFAVTAFAATPFAAPDKRQHAFYGSAAGVLGYSAATAIELPLWARFVAGASAGALLGAAKEGWDATGRGPTPRGTVEVADALWTALPAALLAGVLYLADRRQAAIAPVTR